jgi:hypothetical protein
VVFTQVIAPSGITAGTNAQQPDVLYVKQQGLANGVVLGNQNNSRTIALDYGTAGGLLIDGSPFTSGTLFISDTAGSHSYVGGIEIAADGPSYPGVGLLPWPIMFTNRAADGAITALSSFTALGGASYNALPLDVYQNKSTTANTLALRATAGSSSNLLGGVGTRQVVATSGSEQSEVFLFQNTAGTLTEAMRINQNGQVNFHGVAPTVSSCGTSPSVVGNNTAGTITVGTGGTATSCLLTFATTPAWTNAPHCFVNDQSAIISVQAVPTATTVTFNATLAFAASTLLDYHCVGHF